MMFDRKEVDTLANGDVIIKILGDDTDLNKKLKGLVLEIKNGYEVGE